MVYFESSVKDYVNLDEMFQWVADEATRRLQAGGLAAPGHSHNPNIVVREVHR
jgi:hypothetical protein